MLQWWCRESSMSDDGEIISTLAAENEQLKAQLAAVQDEVALWEEYAEDLEDSHTSMRRIHALLGTAAKKAEPEPEEESEPDAEGIMEALGDIMAGAQSLRAEFRLMAARQALDQLIASLERGSEDEDDLDGFIDADLIHADLQRIRAILETPVSEAPTKCSKSVDATERQG